MKQNKPDLINLYRNKYIDKNNPIHLDTKEPCYPILFIDTPKEAANEDHSNNS